MSERVTLQTGLGDIVLELDDAKAPKTVDNFLRYVDEGHFNGTIFHRVITDFMIQGGGYTADMEQKQTHEPVQNEGHNGLSNARGTIAMARIADPHSATSQFFINVVDNARRLDAGAQPSNPHGYCVFGKVVEGMDVADQIRAVPTDTSGHMQDVPVEPVVIESASRG
ncbi:MAG: peptidylprolyl isomerase [Planctomycetota bacterium]|nr:peptidylprolyl isomerase [Planctomycetota bacterium]